MLREMKALFGDDLWNNVVVGVSFWSFSEAAVQVKQEWSDEMKKLKIRNMLEMEIESKYCK